MDSPRSIAEGDVLGGGTRSHGAERGGGLPVLVLLVIGGAWSLAILARLAGWSNVLGHDHFIEHGPGLGPALALFVGGWQVMIGAMMLPASLPAFGWFSGLISGRRERRGLGASFLAGFVGVWTGFGIVAYFGDFALHHLVDHWKWLAGRPWLIGGSVLIVAGAFELSPLGRRCHTESGYMSPRLGPAHPLAYIDASQMGAEHGFRRLKRCWALMLLSFAAGMASLAWMAALTLVMILQGKRSISERARLHLGIGLLALAGLVIAHRGWMPSLFPSSG